MNKFLKEPLVHFMFLGFLIFGLYSMVSPKSKSDDEIVIDDTEYDYLLSLWKKQWQREPSEKDIQAFVEQYLRQEVYYKEALALGLDHNDIIVKRRLSQKMESVSNDLNSMMEPTTDDDLKEFYEKNPDKFFLPSAYTFQQVLFLENEPDVIKQIEQTKQNLEAGGKIPNSRMSKLSIPNQWTKADPEYLYKSFGGNFYQLIDSLPVGKWSGPIASGFGMHLVRVENKEKKKSVDFESIRDKVILEYQYQRELEMQEKMFRELLEKYPVSITSDKIPTSVKKNILH